MHSFLSSFLDILRLEKSLFRRFPKLRFAAFGALFVPALYTLIYLSSVWDPNSKTSALPVGIVNQDAGIHYRDQIINVGKELVRSLEKKADFGYRYFDDQQIARQQVRAGKLAFALIIPRDFSEHAVPGSQPGAAKLIIYTSEGNDYTGAGFAKRFAPEVAHRVNEALNEKRWELVLTSAAGSQGLGRLKEGIAQLRKGAAELHIGVSSANAGASDLAHGAMQTHDGARRLEGGAKEFSLHVAQLGTGIRQAGAALQTVNAKRPAEADLKALKDGARELAEGQQELGKGLNQLAAGSMRLTDGIIQLKDAASGTFLVSDRLAEGAEEMHGGATQLAAGLEKAQAANASLAAGALRLDEGVGKLTESVARSAGVLQSVISRLPEDARIEALNASAKQLAQGAGTLVGSTHRLQEGSSALTTGLQHLNEGSLQLSSGLNAIAASLPAQGSELEGTAPGLANSVEPSLEIDAPVANQGTGFAPGFITLALWVGAVMTAFLFHFHRIPASLRGAPRMAFVLGKLAIPAVIVLLQAAVMFLTLLYLLHVHLPDVYIFLLTLATASLAFLAVVMALVRLLGDAGKFAAIFLLIVQLSAAGTLMPIELTGKFFQALHPYLPFTWVVRAFRAAMFGAFDGDWLSAWLIVIAIGLLALVIALFAGKWKYVKKEDYRPALEI